MGVLESVDAEEVRAASRDETAPHRPKEAQIAAVVEAAYILEAVRK